jgi:predicted O-methyltransferase YrrM
MKHHEFLEAFHEVYRPRNYLEIGIAKGRSLALSRVPSIAIDPDFRITRELRCDLQLVKAKSQDFFTRSDALDHFKEGAIDFAFIDGLHLFEVALLDFRNVERLATPTSVVIIDDVFPRSADEAARNRHTAKWTGDVFKVGLVLERYRPDLVCVPLDIQPTGLLLAFALDPSNQALDKQNGQLMREFATDDPQDIPLRVLERSNAGDPEAVLRASFWPALLALRDRSPAEAPATPAKVRRLLEGDPVVRRWARQ